MDANPMRVCDFHLQLHAESCVQRMLKRRYKFWPSSVHNVIPNWIQYFQRGFAKYSFASLCTVIIVLINSTFKVSYMETLFAAITFYAYLIFQLKNFCAVRCVNGLNSHLSLVPFISILLWKGFNGVHIKYK